MTDLSTKFQALETVITGRLDTVVNRLDTVIDRLEDVVTAVTAGGNIDAAPIVAAINNLRGEGTENTIKSVNQSIWNLAGPAPGTSLTDLYALLDARLSLIDGNAPSEILDAIRLLLDELLSRMGQNTGDATTTLLGRLFSIQYALTHLDPQAPNLLSVVHHLNNAVGGVPRDALTFTTVRGLLSALRRTVGASSLPPDDMCNDPYVSDGLTRLGPPIYLSPVTAATWQGPTPAGLSLVSGAPDISATNWANWRVYVQSPASLFGDDATGNARLPTNTWHDLSGSGVKRFYVDGDNSITVYLCGKYNPNDTTLSSEVVTISSVLGTVTRHNIIWPSTYEVTNTATFNQTYTFQPACLAVGDFRGATITLLSGPLARIVGYMGNGVAFEGQVNQTNNTYTITQLSDKLLIDNYDTGDPGQPFTIGWQR